VLKVWYTSFSGVGGDGKVKKRNMLQRKVARLITNIGRVTSYRELFKLLNIIPVCILITLWTIQN
jgi:hypothetical protein